MGDTDENGSRNEIAFKPPSMDCQTPLDLGNGKRTPYIRKTGNTVEYTR